MQKNEILKIYGTDYKEMTKQLLARAELATEIPSKNAKIGIKPNLVTPTPADYGATTHPEEVAGILEYLAEHGFFDMVILEGAWVGDLTSEAFVACGYQELADRYGVQLWDTQKDSSHAVDCGGMELQICDKVAELDFLINVPVLKGHCQTKITCALKNSKGLIPNAEKRRFHTIGLHKPIAHLGVGIRQDFVVVDHICGDLDFEEGGNPVVRNCIMAVKDPVLMDAYVCHLLGYDVSEVPYVVLAEKLGVGCADLSQAQIFTLKNEGAGEVKPEAGRRRKVLDVSYAVEEVDSCSACYANLIPALDLLNKEGKLSQLKTRIAIGQGYRGQGGVLGIGHCTAGFDVCINGCPPKTADIYDGLCAYIAQSGDNPTKDQGFDG